MDTQSNSGITYLKYTFSLLTILFSAVLLNLDKFEHGFIKAALHVLFQFIFMYGVLSIFKKIFIARVIIAALIVTDILIHLTYKTSLDISIIMSVLEATPGEAADFMTSNPWSVLITSLLFVGLIGKQLVADNNLAIYTLVIGSAYIIIPTIIDSKKIMNGYEFIKAVDISTSKGQSRYVAMATPVIKNMMYRFRPLGELIGIGDTITFFSKKYKNNGSWKDVRSSANSPNLLVLVLGESLRAKNMSLYGYGRETTPKLDGIVDKFTIYKHAYAGGPNTWSSVPAMFTLNSTTLNMSYSIVELAKKAGYRTHWYSNQAEFSRWDYSVSTIARQSDDVYFVSSRNAGSEYDGVLVDHFMDLLKSIKDGEKNFIVINLYGSHFKFKDRYPENFSVFKSSNRQLDQYDNSILYTDTLLAKIAKLTEKKNGQFMFFSDHGLGGPDSKTPLLHDVRLNLDIEVLHVPFLTFKNSLLKVDPNRVISLFYFECIFSQWSGVHAKELSTEYCKKAFSDNITYRDIQFKNHRHNISVN